MRFSYQIVVVLTIWQLCCCRQNDVVLRGQEIIQEFYARFNATGEVDLVFVLDRSASVPRQGWNSMMEFVRNILDHFVINPLATRVSVITFSTTVSVDINDLDNDDEDKCTLISRLDSFVQHKMPNGFTATFAALQKAEAVLLKSRKTSKKAVFILTDGKSNIGSPPVRASFDIRSLRWDTTWPVKELGPQVEIYAFGIADANMGELKAIAWPMSNHTFLIPDFKLFDQLARSLHGDRQTHSWEVADHFSCKGRCHGNAQCTCATALGQYGCVCMAGYQGDGIKCSACPLGFYKDSLSPEKCRPCPANSTTHHSGARDVSECRCFPAFHKLKVDEPCQLKYCEALEPIQNGIMFHVRGSSRDEVPPTKVPCRNTPYDSCHYACDVGYRLSGEPALVCQPGGLWEGQRPNCTLIDCKRLEDIHESDSNSKVTYLYNTTSYLSVVNVTCNFGFRPFGDTERMCGQNGVWLGTPVYCSEIRCLPLPVEPFLTVSPSGCSTSKQSFLTSCSFTCAWGFVRHGDFERTCGYNNRWTGQQPFCEDNQKPSITCPSAIEIEADRGLDYAIIHTDRLTPLVSDNSGNVSFKILNYKDNKFYVGLHLVTYIAIDAWQNTDACTQNVRVYVATARVEHCPVSQVVVDVVTSSIAVSWEEPIFLDQSNSTLQYECSRDSGSKFTVGDHNVICRALMFTNVVCRFSVNVRAKKCPEVKAPIHGSSTCVRNGVPPFLLFCSVSCNKGYDFVRKPAIHYFCTANGEWGAPPGEKFPWPHCTRRYRPNRAIMRSKAEFYYYEGRCERNKDKIKEAFIKKVKKEVFNPTCQYMMTLTDSCKIELDDVQVRCGYDARRRRRSADELSHLSSTTQAVFNSTAQPGFNSTAEPAATSTHSKYEIVYVQFTVSSFTNVTVESKHEQFNIYLALEEVVYTMNDLIDKQDMNISDNGTVILSPVTKLNESIWYAFEDCPYPMVSRHEEYSLLCLDCPEGMYHGNGSCVPCPVGSYQDEMGQMECKPCPTNLTTAEVGSFNSSFCIAKCSAGSFSSMGIEPCDLCDLGSFQPVSGATQCQLCPFNQTTSRLGSVSETDCGSVCEPGWFNNGTGLTPCSQCPNNTYQPESGSRLCIQCPSGKRTSSPGSVSLTDCFEVDYCRQPDAPKCLNGGSCENGLGSRAQCNCSPGYSGALCEQEVNECASSPCLHGATCDDLVNKFRCNCPNGFEGTLCEQEMNDCLENPCLHGGSCEDRRGGFKCFCQKGYTGDRCETDIDDCASNPCVQGECIDGLNEITCICQTGYTGNNCDFLLDYCVSAPCQNNAACESSLVDFKCTCLPGFTGKHCDSIIDPCADSKCGDNATCQALLDQYSCICPAGFTGPHCDQQLSPDFDMVFSNDSSVNYAASKIRQDLYHVTVCLWLRTTDRLHYGTPFSYHVDSNWLGLEDNSGNTLTLTDYNQLKLFVNGEMASTTISLTDGMWHYVCVSWNSNGGHWQVVINGTTVQEGFNLAAGTYIQAGGNMIIGHYQHLDMSFNERESFIGEIHGVNVYGASDLDFSPKCRANDGDVIAWSDFLSELKGQVDVRNISYCGDVNECVFPDVFHCTSHYQCTDLVGSYTCDSCTPGYEGSDCQRPVDECLSTPCQNNATCRDGPELGDVSCDCLLGYTGTICDTMINLCDSNPCLRGGTCTSSPNDFHCSCPCPSNNPGKRCESCYGHCLKYDPCVNGGQCIDEESQVHCICPHGYQGIHCEIQIDYCRNDSCKNNGTCISIGGGGFRCTCLPGWRGEFCEVSYTPGCEMEPCINGGTCVPSSDSGQGYYCQCPPVEGDYEVGKHCEVLSPCDVDPIKCLNGATCVSLDGPNMYRCMCTANYTGRHCQLSTIVTDTPSRTSVMSSAVSTEMATVSPVTGSVTDSCATVMCLHGGSCLITVTGGFYCRCTIEYYGEYCKHQYIRKSVTFMVEVKLLIDYDTLLPQLEGFKSDFKKDIHNLYADVLNSRSRIEVEILKISRGSVIVKFRLNVTTYSEDGHVYNMDSIKGPLVNSLVAGQLGSYIATKQQFVFEKVSADQTAKGSGSLFLIIAFCIVSFLILIAVIITVLMCKKRRKDKAHKLAPHNDFIVHPVSNPAYIGDNLRNVQLLHAHMPSAEENMYAELNEVAPYAISDLKMPLPQDDYLQPMSESDEENGGYLTPIRSQ